MTDYKTVLWDATGPYWLDAANGKKSYIPPATAMQTTTDPKLVAWGKSHQAPAGGFLHSRGQWNSDTGKWDQPINWGNLMSAGIGGAIAAPAVVGLIGGGAGAAGAGGTAAATTGSVAGTAGTAGTVGATSASLASRLLTSPSLWGTVSSTIGGIYSANKQIAANKEAAQLQADAAKYATDATTKASEAAEKFLREQAQYGYAASEAANKANYGQFSARERRLASIGNLLGAGPREIPDYVPQPDPHFTGGSPTTPSVGQSLSGAPPNVVDGSAESISAYFKSRGVSDRETPYWVQKWAEFGAKDPAYFNQRLAQADIFGGGQTVVPQATQRIAYQPYIGSSVGNLLSRYQPTPLPPTLLAQRGY